MDNLARNAMLARQAGMSYGKWKALQPVVTPDRKELPEGWRVCANCGKEFKGRSNKKYCNPDCKYENRRKRTGEEDRRW